MNFKPERICPTWAIVSFALFLLCTLGIVFGWETPTPTEEEMPFVAKASVVVLLALYGTYICLAGISQWKSNVKLKRYSDAARGASMDDLFGCVLGYSKGTKTLSAEQCFHEFLNRIEDSTLTGTWDLKYLPGVVRLALKRTSRGGVPDVARVAIDILQRRSECRPELEKIASGGYERCCQGNRDLAQMALGSKVDARQSWYFIRRDPWSAKVT